MAQFGEQQPGRLALASGQVLRSGRMVIKTITPKKRGDSLSGFPNAPLSPGQANFGARGQTSGLPSVSPAQGFLQQMQAALARVGRNGLTTEDLVDPSSLTFQDITPVRPRPPEPARPSDVDLQADASEQILKELQRVIASQERMHAEVTAVTAEMRQVRDEVQAWRAEMEKTVRTVELNEAQLRTQILGTAEGLVQVEQKLHARALNRDMSVSRTSWHKGVILGRNSVFGVFRL
jgi:hypothetical protein